MKKNYFLLTIILVGLMSNAVLAQKTYTSKSDSDKDALRILDKTKGVLKNAKTTIFDYSLVIAIPEEEPQVTNGIAKQKGERFYIEMGDKTIYCNGRDVRIYSQVQNEVQINDIDEDSGLLTPSTVLNLFDKDSYIFILGVEKKINKKKYYNLIFKPTEKFSEYTKIEAFIDKKSFLPYRIKMFYKDGTKNTLDIESALINKAIDDSVFSFDKQKHPDVSVEDLRMD